MIMEQNWNAKQARDYINKLEAELMAAEEKAKKANFDFAGKKIMQLEPYKMPSTSPSVVFKEMSFSRKWYPDQAQATADELYEHDKAVRERNKSIAANNNEIREALIVLMKNLGFAETTRQKVNRSYRNPKYETVQVAWRDYLNGIPGDSWGNQIDRIYKEWCDKIKKRREEIEAEKKKEQAQRDQDQRKRDEMKLLVSLGLKYGQEFNAVDSAIDYLLDQDKYLALAYYLEKNRGDWNDGCDYARSGLSRFKIESPGDNQIFQEINSLCEDFEDGRVFRDCTWNYGVLYGMADKDKLADLNAAREYERDY